MRRDTSSRPSGPASGCTALPLASATRFPASRSSGGKPSTPSAGCRSAGTSRWPRRRKRRRAARLKGRCRTSSFRPTRIFEAKPVWKRMIIILAGVTMNALFAWLVFSGLAATNGRAVDPETRVGVVDTTGLPAALAPLAQLAPGDSIEAVNGVPMHPVGRRDRRHHERGVGHGHDRGGGQARDSPPIHRDAVEERAQAAQALTPWRGPVSRLGCAGHPGEPCGMQVGDTIESVAGVPTPNWYDLTTVVRQYPGRYDSPRHSPRRRAAYPHGCALRGGASRGRRIGNDDRQDRRGIPRGAWSYQPLGFFAALGAGYDATVNASTTVVRSVRGMLTGRGVGPEHRRADPDRADGGAVGRGRPRRLLRLPRTDLDQPGGAEPAADPDPGRRPVPLPAGGGQSSGGRSRSSCGSA